MRNISVAILVLVVLQIAAVDGVAQTLDLSGVPDVPEVIDGEWAEWDVDVEMPRVAIPYFSSSQPMWAETSELYGYVSLADALNAFYFGNFYFDLYYADVDDPHDERSFVFEGEDGLYYHKGDDGLYYWNLRDGITFHEKCPWGNVYGNSSYGVYSPLLSPDDPFCGYGLERYLAHLPRTIVDPLKIKENEFAVDYTLVGGHYFHLGTSLKGEVLGYVYFVYAKLPKNVSFPHGFALEEEEIECIVALRRIDTGEVVFFRAKAQFIYNYFFGHVFCELHMILPYELPGLVSVFDRAKPAQTAWEVMTGLFNMKKFLSMMESRSGSMGKFCMENPVRELGSFSLPEWKVCLDFDELSQESWVKILRSFLLFTVVWNFISSCVVVLRWK
jgi:hypothetical protein